MGLHKTNAEEYAELMKHYGNGNYLYVPERFSKLHPGSIGYFDHLGAWNEVTDLSQPGRAEADGYTSPGRALILDEPKEAMWKTQSSESGSERSMNLTGGLSGAAAAAPVDVSATGKNKSTSDKKAALVTGSLVKWERLVSPVHLTVQSWVVANARALVASDFGEDIKKYGLVAVQSTWVTPECAITLTTDKSRDFNVGLEVGATGFGKAGAGGSTLQKLKSEGWSTYESKESDKGLVVSFAGATFKLRAFSKWRSNPLTQVERAGHAETLEAVYDANGNITGYEPKVSEGGEEEEKEEEMVIDIEGAPIGVSESEIEEEKQFAKKEEEKKQAEFQAKALEIMKIPEGPERDAARKKLLEENSHTEVTTVNVNSWI